jgi:hypothetical protein
MKKSREKPHARCGAKCRTRNGEPCRNAAMPNGRCRMHGGKSTGPKTKEGLCSITVAATKHGFYAKKAKNERKQVRVLLQSGRELLEKHSENK